MSETASVMEVKRADAASYAVTAASFDDLTERFSAPLAQVMLDLAHLQSDSEVLDVGTGTGLVALRAARTVTAGSVLGIDHSAGMLERASSKAAELGIGDRVRFKAMDAEALDLPDKSFDAVLSLFVLLHLPHRLAAVKEMHRVLRPGGRLVVAVGSRPPIFSVAAIIRGVKHVAFLTAMALGRRLLAPHFLHGLMKKHGIDGLEAHGDYNNSAGIEETLKAAGFDNFRTLWRGDVVDLDEEDFWAVQAVYGSAARIVLSNEAVETVEALRSDFIDTARRVRSMGGKLIYRYGAKFYVATRE